MKDLHKIEMGVFVLALLLFFIFQMSKQQLPVASIGEGCSYYGEDLWGWDTCLLNEFILSGNFLCDKLHFEAFTYQCLALKNLDPEVCKNIKGDMTYSPATKEDLSEHEQAKCRDNIIIYRAEVVEKNPNLCSELSDSSRADDCYMFFELCDKIKGSFTKAECMRNKLRREGGINVSLGPTWYPWHQYQ